MYLMRAVFFAVWILFQCDCSTRDQMEYINSKKQTNRKNVVSSILHLRTANT